jgi:Amt family ammonium transporter
MLGIFADKAFNPAGTNGLIYGNSTFFFKQLAATVFSSVWAFVFTFGMLKVIDIFTPVKVTHSEERAGLDTFEFGEHAYEDTLAEDALEPETTSV